MWLSLGIPSERQVSVWVKTVTCLYTDENSQQLWVWGCLTPLVMRKYPVRGPINSNLRVTMAAWVVKAMNTWSFSSSVIFADRRFNCWDKVAPLSQQKRKNHDATQSHDCTECSTSMCAKTRSAARTVIVKNKTKKINLHYRAQQQVKHRRESFLLHSPPVASAAERVWLSVSQ